MIPKKIKNYKHLLSCELLFLFVSFFLLFWPQDTYAYSAGKIIEDGTFRNSNSMTESQIQQFLEVHNSYLASYKIPYSQYAVYWVGDKQITSYVNTWIGPIGQEVDSTNWPVSKVIYYASRWYNVNPQVIISIIQKESSLAADSNHINWAPPERYARLAWIMGYAYTESGISNACYTSTNRNPTGSCAGVAMQIDWAAGALDSWFKKSQSGSLTCNGGQPCWYGQSPIIDNQRVYIENHITGPFYRYTPHLTWGGSFTWCMQNWFPYYDYEFVSAINPPSVIGAGQTKSAQIVLKNTGQKTWHNDSQNPLVNPMRLYVYYGQELYSDEGSWESAGRIRMTTPVVAPGQNGIFNFTIKTPQIAPAIYSLRFFPIIENSQMLKDVGMRFDISVPDWHVYKFISAINPPMKVQPGQVADVQIVLQNLGSAPWISDSVTNYRPFRLKVYHGSPNFYESSTWFNQERIIMTSQTVNYGEKAYFNFKMRAPSIPGQYSIKFYPTIDGLVDYNDIGMGFSSRIEESGSVSRYWNIQRSGHFYTANAEEKTIIDNDLNWKYEGEKFIVDYLSSSDNSPVYRFWSKNLMAHFYTISESEKNNVIANMPEWKYEGIAWYAKKSASLDYKAVYRFWSDIYKKHFYTISESEKNNVIANMPEWKYEGIAWYAK